jgi:hypothetical protein
MRRRQPWSTFVLVGLISMGVAAQGADPVVKTAGVVKSLQYPELDIFLPTDNLPTREGPPVRVAAITTVYFKYSHADDIITKFIEGYSVVGRIYNPHCKVVSLYVEQFPESDIGRGMASRYGIQLYSTVREALTLGGEELAVDAVLLIGEHGDYPSNEKGQHLYPRRRLFGEIVKVFRQSGHGVPVFNDKHLSYAWHNAEWMYRQSRELDFPLMAGSSIPVTWRRPALSFLPGVELEAALSIGYGGIESYGFHTLETLQTFTEKRHGGESGIRAVECLEGKAAWQAAKEGRWSVELLRAALDTTPLGAVSPDAIADPSKQLPPDADLEALDPNAMVFLIEYTDGFRAASYLARGLVEQFAFAARVKGRAEPVATWCWFPRPQRDNFSFLSNHIEVMFRSGKPSYPVERTLLVSGALEKLIDSHVAKGQRVETPHLQDLKYTPVTEPGPKE